MSDLPTILIVDDEVRSLETLERMLSDEFDVRTAATTGEAASILEEEWVQLILCDQRMPEQTGVEFLKEVRARWPETIRMIISGYTDPGDVIRSVNEAGIYQYVTKPWHPENLILTLKNAVRLSELQRENDLLSVEMKLSADRAEQVVSARRADLRKAYKCDDGVIRSTESPMNEICQKVLQVAPYDISVLVTGESGTGKELIARALHYNSLRWNKPFVVENCAALPDELLESELFGHRRGAFTGAVDDHVGLFERADGGTVFLDEIGEVSRAFQVKLLRVLQEGEIRPVGAARPRSVNVRVVAATNKVLEEEVRAGRFREDLYYRLTTVTIELPPLRRRRSDVRVLAAALVAKLADTLGKKIEGISQEALDRLADYHWPGNVRELQNELQHMLVMAPDGGELGPELISPRILRGPVDEDEEEPAIEALGLADGTLKDRVETFECRILRETLIRHRWNKSRAARELGLSRVGLRGKLERYGLEKVEALAEKSLATGAG